jgi:hypothetical protein
VRVRTVSLLPFLVCNSIYWDLSHFGWWLFPAPVEKDMFYTNYLWNWLYENGHYFPHWIQAFNICTANAYIIYTNLLSCFRKVILWHQWTKSLMTSHWLIDIDQIFTKRNIKFVFVFIITGTIQKAGNIGTGQRIIISYLWEFCIPVLSMYYVILREICDSKPTFYYIITDY